jgi:hypothetical protein
MEVVTLSAHKRLSPEQSRPERACCPGEPASARPGPAAARCLLATIDLSPLIRALFSERRRIMSISFSLRERFTSRALGSRRSTIALVAMRFQTAGTTSVVVAGIVGLVYVSFQAGAPDPEDSPGSGIIVRTEVTAVWIPRALHEDAQIEAGAPVFLSPDALDTALKRRGLNDSWYSITYRHHQVNGEFQELTQIRRLSEAADHLDEFQAVMATAAGNPPRHQGRDFSHARVEVIPETLQSVGRRLQGFPSDCSSDKKGEPPRS